jgi:hypothetical protein
MPITTPSQGQDTAYRPARDYTAPLPMAFARIPQAGSPGGEFFRPTAEETRTKQTAAQTETQRAAARAILEKLTTDPTVRDYLQTAGAFKDLYGVTPSREDLETPVERAARLTGERTDRLAQIREETTIREGVQDRFARAREGRAEARERRKGQIPITLKDDPALPAGVKQALANYPRQYPTFEAAVKAVQYSLPEQQRLHPGLSPEKVMSYLKALYQPSAGSIDAFELPDVEAPPMQRAATPAPPSAGEPTPFTPGTVVTLRDGRRIRIKAIAGGQITDYDEVR